MHGSEIESLKADLRRMQARVAELETAGEEPTNRRNMLRGLGAAAAGAAVGGLAFARPAGAADGNDLAIGNQTQTSQTPTMLVSTATAVENSQFLPAFCVSDDGTFSNINAFLSCIGAYADSGGPGADHTVAFWGASTSGIGAKLDGPVPLKLTDASGGGNPSQSGGSIGQFVVGTSSTGDLWFCVDDDSSHNWRKLAGIGTAGAFHALTPYRAYDSRAALSPATGILNAGASREVSIKDKRNADGSVNTSNMVPSGATAVTANVTVTGTTGGFGFLCVNPGGDTSQATSAINWFGAGQSLANGLTLTLDTNREVRVVCGTGGGNTHFIIDVSGYYL